VRSNIVVATSGAQEIAALSNADDVIKMVDQNGCVSI
jgi:hypothetical protein